MFHSNWFYHNYIFITIKLIDKNITGNVCFLNTYFLSYKYMYVSFCRLIFAAFQINKKKKNHMYCNCYTCVVDSFWSNFEKQKTLNNGRNILMDWLIDWLILEVFLAVIILMAIFFLDRYWILLFFILIVILYIM